MPRLPTAEIARLKPLILARVEAGEGLRAVLLSLGLKPHLAQGWAGRDPAFRADLTRALGAETRRRAVDQAQMQAFVARIWAGAKVRELLNTPGMPSSRLYTYWLRTQGWFAEEMGRHKEAERANQAARALARRRPFDPKVADTIYARLWTQGSLKRVLTRDPQLPGWRVVERWRSEQPAFDQMLRAVTAGWRSKRSRERRRATMYTQATVDRVMEHVAYGGSLTSAAREPGMPGRKTLGLWMKKHPAFARAILTAYDDRDWADGHALIGPEGGGGPRDRSARERVRRRIGGLKRRPGRPYGAVKDEGEDVRQSPRNPL